MADFGELANQTLQRSVLFLVDEMQKIAIFE